jgi:hypothetical protein
VLWHLLLGDGGLCQLPSANTLLLLLLLHSCQQPWCCAPQGSEQRPSRQGLQISTCPQQQQQQQAASSTN